MNTPEADPWTNESNAIIGSEYSNCFEDCFVENQSADSKLPDSEQYLQSLHSRLKAVQGGTTKKDLVNSLSAVKEDCIARLLTAGPRFKTEEEAVLASNPLIRHIAPHLQALTSSELISLLKADELQAVTTEAHNQSSPQQAPDSQAAQDSEEKSQ